MAEVYRYAPDLVAHLDGVGGAVVDAAGVILGRARANLAAVRDEGRHEVNLRLGVQTDAFVVLEGPFALAVERGHFTESGDWVEGAHILRDAVQPGE